MPTPPRDRAPERERADDRVETSVASRDRTGSARGSCSARKMVSIQALTAGSRLRASLPLVPPDAVARFIPPVTGGVDRVGVAGGPDRTSGKQHKACVRQEQAAWLEHARDVRQGKRLL